MHRLLVVIDDQMRKTAVCAYLVKTSTKTQGFLIEVFYTHNSWLEAFIQRYKEALQRDDGGFERRVPPHNPLKGKDFGRLW